MVCETKNKPSYAAKPHEVKSTK